MKSGSIGTMRYVSVRAPSSARTRYSVVADTARKTKEARPWETASRSEPAWYPVSPPHYGFTRQRASSVSNKVTS